MAQVLIFGDSISFGMWDELGGWPSRLMQHLNKQVISSDLEEFIATYAMGIPGNTSEDLVSRFEVEMNPRINTEQETTIIFAIGTNDSHLINPGKKNAVNLETFEHNLIRLYEMARHYAKNIYFVGLPMVDEKRTDPLFWMHERSYVNEEIKKYDAIIRKVTQDVGIGFIDIYSEFEVIDHAKLLSDGLHPNTEGHRVIFEKVLESIKV